MFKKRKARKALKKRQKAFLRRQKKLDFGVFVHINAKIWLTITSWMFWRRSFNAILIGKYEYESLQRLSYAFKMDDVLTGKDLFVSHFCPGKEIEVIPTTAPCGIHVANIRPT